MTVVDDFKVPAGGSSGSRDPDLFLPPGLLGLYRTVLGLACLVLERTDQEFLPTVFHDDHRGTLHDFTSAAVGGPLSTRDAAMDDVRRRLRAAGASKVVVVHEAWSCREMPQALRSKLPDDMGLWPEPLRRRLVQESVIAVCEARGDPTVVLVHRMTRSDAGHRRVHREPRILPGTARGRFTSLLS